MFKKGPLEKEKILQRLTEKEIKNQLYGFNAKLHQPVNRETIVKKEEKTQQVNEQGPKKEPKVLKNPYLFIQVALLVLFLILTWISLRQVIKAVSKLRRPQTTVEQNMKQKAVKQQKAKPKPRRM